MRNIHAPTPERERIEAENGFTVTERSHVPGHGGRSIKLEYQAGVGTGSLSIAVENRQGQMVWQAVPPTGDKNSRASQVIAMNQSGRYVIVIEGRAAVGRLDLSWANIR